MPDPIIIIGCLGFLLRIDTLSNPRFRYYVSVVVNNVNIRVHNQLQDYILVAARHWHWLVVLSCGGSENECQQSWQPLITAVESGAGRGRHSGSGKHECSS